MEKIFVLFGGCSNEREVSLDSGRNVTEALASLGRYEVTGVDLKADSLDGVDLAQAGSSPSALSSLAVKVAVVVLPWEPHTAIEGRARTSDAKTSPRVERCRAAANSALAESIAGV